MRLRHVAPSSMIASIFVVVPLWSGSATVVLRHGAFLMPSASPATQSAMVPAAKPVDSTHYVRLPQSDDAFNLTLPVADRTTLPTPLSHPKPRHYKAVRHNSGQAQQYYQPARQYYEWHVH